MRLTQNAPTYQTRAHWALCPHITDFLQRANGKTRSFVFLLSPGPQIFFWSLDACGDSGVIGILDFPFTRIAALIWSKMQTQGNSAEKLGNDSRNKQKDKHIRCSHRHSHNTSLCKIRRRFIGSNWRLTAQPVKFTAGRKSPVVLNPPPAPGSAFQWVCVIHIKYMLIWIYHENDFIHIISFLVLEGSNSRLR